MEQPEKKTIIIIVAVVVTVLLAFGAILAWSQDVLVRDGATCDVPDGFNTATYDKDYNLKGMGEFCVFPHQKVVSAFKDAIDDLRDQAEGNCPVLPECGGLVIGPGGTGFPCVQSGP